MIEPARSWPPDVRPLTTEEAVQALHSRAYQDYIYPWTALDSVMVRMLHNGDAVMAMGLEGELLVQASKQLMERHGLKGG